MVSYDDLTGALTFKSFIETVTETIQNSAESEYAIFVWDVEGFKAINEIFGMETGDRVLKKMVDVCRKNVVKTAIIGRIGGDKFVCCCHKDELDEALKNIRTVYDIHNGKEKYQIFIHAGVYYVEDNSLPVIKMCDRALLALQKIKGNLGKKIAVFTQEDREQLVMGRQLVSDMPRAIENKEFYIVIQPIFDANTGKIVSGEVLARWKHPKYGNLPTSRFIPLFESNYMISKLDCYVWEEACILLRRMLDNNMEMLPLSINVSRADMTMLDLETVLPELLNKYGIPASLLRVEVTESAYMDNPERMVKIVKTLKEKGFTILMDDFGTGYSSMTLLKDLNFDILKIDKKLVDEIGVSNKAGNLISSVIQMAKWLKMEVVCEGVEYSNQASFLRNLECNYIQGYLYSKPVDIDSFITMCGNDEEKETGAGYMDIDLDNLINLDNIELRSFISEIVGPMAIYSCKGDDLKLVKVNKEYLKLYNISPKQLFADGFAIFSEAERGNVIRVSQKCRQAKKSGKTQYVVISRLTYDERILWVGVSIKYIGRHCGEDMYLFDIRDVTNLQNRINRQDTQDFYPLLCRVYNEILEINYTEDTVTTLYKDCKIITDNKKRQLNEALSMFAEYVVVKDDRNLFMNRLSGENMKKFFESEEKFFVFNIMVNGSNGVVPCEYTVIKNSEEQNEQTVIVCTREHD